MKTRSLTRTLMIGVLLAELTCALLFSALALGYQRNGRRHAFDVMLGGRADSVLGAVQDAEDRDDNVIVDQSELPLPHEDAYEVRMESGRVVGRSPGSAEAVLAALDTGRTDGFFNFEANGKQYRAIRKPGLRVIDREDQAGGLRRPVTILYAAPTAHLWHEAFEAVRFYVIASCLLVLLTGAAIAWFLRRSLSPLRELALRAERVSAEAWEFEAPREALETRELEPIAASLQKLLLSLRAAFERQRQFTGDAAHELKTSIAVLKSRLQLAAMRERSAEEYRRNLEELLTDTERMEHLTSRMLTLARVEESTLGAEEQCDLSAAMQLTVSSLQPVAELRGVVIAVHAAGSSVVGLSLHDAGLLCSNLLMNALQHSAPGSEVSLSISQRHDGIEFCVADYGNGIAPETLPHLFDRFYRGDASRSRTDGGAGLGLAICKAIVTRAGGSIAIESVLGEGTVVNGLLPLATRSPQVSV